MGVCIYRGKCIKCLREYGRGGVYGGKYIVWIYMEIMTLDVYTLSISTFSHGYLIIILMWNCWNGWGIDLSFHFNVFTWVFGNYNILSLYPIHFNIYICVFVSIISIDLKYHNFQIHMWKRENGWGIDLKCHNF